MNTKFISLLFVATAMIATATFSHADNVRYYWNPDVFGSFNAPAMLDDGANWQGGTVPTADDSMVLAINTDPRAESSYYFGVPVAGFTLANDPGEGHHPVIGLDTWSSQRVYFEFSGGDLTLLTRSEWHQVISLSGGSAADLYFKSNVNIVDDGNPWPVIQIGGNGGEMRFEQDLKFVSGIRNMDIGISSGNRDGVFRFAYLDADTTATGRVNIQFGTAGHGRTPAAANGYFFVGELSDEFRTGDARITLQGGTTVLTDTSANYANVNFALGSESGFMRLLLEDGIKLTKEVGGTAYWFADPTFGTYGAGTAEFAGMLRVWSHDGDPETQPDAKTGIFLSAEDSAATLIISGGIDRNQWTKGLGIIGNGTVLIKDTAISMNNGIKIGNQATYMTVKLGGNTTLTGAAQVFDGAGLTSRGGDLTFATSLDLTEMNTDGGLEFHIGASNGVISATLLDIGILDATEFRFVLTGGFGEGDYTLFYSTNTILGTLDTTSVFALGAAYQGSLAWGANNESILLSVVAIPEPATWLLLGASLLVVTVLRRKKLS